eukprot:COSAG05_NODE_1129_length_5779_cov_11.914789_8_plen_63_part_00
MRQRGVMTKRSNVRSGRWRELVEDAVKSGSKERVLTPARAQGLLVVAGVTAIKQSLSLPKAD